jgi:hypothetical protein
VFLGLAGLAEDGDERPEGGYRASPTQEWLTRAVREVWRLRPVADAAPPVPAVRRLLRDDWVRRQMTYFRARGRRHHVMHRMLSVASGCLFAITVLVATLHALGIGHETTVGKVLILISITLPALGGALSGIDAIEQNHRHAERFASMARRLESLADRISLADDLRSLQILAVRAEGELRAETDQWIDVMRYYDIELA